jgi:hypothetical protein
MWRDEGVQNLNHRIMFLQDSYLFCAVGYIGKVNI